MIIQQIITVCLCRGRSLKNVRTANTIAWKKCVQAANHSVGLLFFITYNGRNKGAATGLRDSRMHKFVVTLQCIAVVYLWQLIDKAHHACIIWTTLLWLRRDRERQRGLEVNVFHQTDIYQTDIYIFVCFSTLNAWGLSSFVRGF